MLVSCTRDQGRTGELTIGSGCNGYEWIVEVSASLLTFFHLHYVFWCLVRILLFRSHDIILNEMVSGWEYLWTKTVPFVRFCEYSICRRILLQVYLTFLSCTGPKTARTLRSKAKGTRREDITVVD